MMFIGVPLPVSGAEYSLRILIGEWGMLIYLLLFLVILLESGVPPMIWLPGDSLLLMSGLLASGGYLDIRLLILTYFLAGVTGYQINYHLGSRVGLPFISKKFPDIVTDERLKKTGTFFCRYGNTALIPARFVPVVRTLAPFIAGISGMNRRSFFVINILSAGLWSGIVSSTGYLCGKIPWFQENIVAVSILFFIGASAPLIGTLVTILRAEKKKQKR